MCLACGSYLKTWKAVGVMTWEEFRLVLKWIKQLLAKRAGGEVLGDKILLFNWHGKISSNTRHGLSSSP